MGDEDLDLLHVGHYRGDRAPAETTMHLYVHAYDEDMRGAVATLDAALGS